MAASAKVDQLVTFLVNREEYGIPIMDVFEIIFVPAMTEIAKAPPSIIGIVNLRGQIIPVVDLRVLFNRLKAEPSKKQRVIVTRANGQVIGLLVDEVTEVLRTDRAEVDRTPQTLTSVHTAYIQAIYKLVNRMVVLLNMENVLQAAESNWIANGIGSAYE